MGREGNKLITEGIGGGGAGKREGELQPQGTNAPPILF